MLEVQALPNLLLNSSVGSNSINLHFINAGIGNAMDYTPNMDESKMKIFVELV